MRRGQKVVSVEPCGTPPDQGGTVALRSVTAIAADVAPQRTPRLCLGQREGRLCPAVGRGPSHRPSIVKGCPSGQQRERLRRADDRGPGNPLISGGSLSGPGAAPERNAATASVSGPCQSSWWARGCASENGRTKPLGGGDSAQSSAFPWNSRANPLNHIPACCAGDSMTVPSTSRRTWRDPRAALRRRLANERTRRHTRAAFPRSAAAAATWRTRSSNQLARTARGAEAAARAWRPRTACARANAKCLPAVGCHVPGIVLLGAVGC